MAIEQAIGAVVMLLSYGVLLGYIVTIERRAARRLALAPRLERIRQMRGVR